MIQATEGNRNSWDHSTAENAGCVTPGLLCGGPLRSFPCLYPHPQSLMLQIFSGRQRGRDRLVWSSAPSLEEPSSLCGPGSSGQRGFWVWPSLRWLPAPWLVRMDLLPLTALFSSPVKWGQLYHRQECNQDVMRALCSHLLMWRKCL